METMGATRAANAASASGALRVASAASAVRPMRVPRRYTRPSRIAD